MRRLDGRTHLGTARAAWVADLRSGRYRQARGALTRDGGFCCLGVACLRYDPQGDWLVGSDLLDSPATKRTLGVRTDTGRYNGLSLGHDRMSSLADGNDIARYSFDQIADTIEAEPRGLFVGHSARGNV